MDLAKESVPASDSLSGPGSDSDSLPGLDSDSLSELDSVLYSAASQPGSLPLFLSP